MKIKVYIAGHYSHRLELLKRARELEELGHYEVTSRWLLGLHERRDTDPTDQEKTEWAREDLTNVDEADLLIAFVDMEPSRGGKETEFGYALGIEMPTIVVGESKNIFYVLGDKHFKSWEECKIYLKGAIIRPRDRKEATQLSKEGPSSQ